MRKFNLLLAIGACTLLAAMFGAPVEAQAQGCQNPPEPITACSGDCGTPNQAICTEGGFKLTLVKYEPAALSTSGGGTYTYQICSPLEGTCDGTVRNGESCLDNEFCQKKGQNTDPTAKCSRVCAVDKSFGLSHFDVDFPSFGTCLSTNNSVTGTCACVGGFTGCSVNPTVVLGDGSCYCSGSTVAKCDNTTLPVGACIEMVLTISGETTVVGLGNTVVVDKESTTCTETCLAGPTCKPPEDCEDGEDNDCDGTIDCFDPDCSTAQSCGDGGECLTRTLGFWGTHPWITNDYAPVTVCGKTLGCNGTNNDGSGANGKSNPACLAGHCTDIMEGLGSVGGELKNGAAYIAMVKQLTAAKLNLNATAAATGDACAGFTYGGKAIQQWIADCELLCGSDQATISSSGCIEALNAFNNSDDVLDGATPPPFDRPPVDDFGNVSGADPNGFTAAQGNSTPPGKWVIGKKVGSNDCR